MTLARARAVREASTASPSTKMERNMAKFRETTSMPMPGPSVSRAVTMASLTPLVAVGLRRMTSREAPRMPQGLKPRSASGLPSTSLTVTTTSRSSTSARVRSRAMEKPRSSPLRQSSAARRSCSRSSWIMSPRRRTSTVAPEERTRRTALATAGWARRSKLAALTMASSPMRRALRPASL